MPAYTAAKPETRGRQVEPGIYPAEIFDARETVSKQGNPMIELFVQIKGGPLVKEHLVFTPKAVWKVDIVRAAIGEAVIEGETIDITPDRFIGKSATVEVGIKDGDQGGKFNEIVQWVMPGKSAAKPSADDDIPF